MNQYHVRLQAVNGLVHTGEALAGDGGKRLPDGRSMTQVLRLEQFAVRGDEREFGRG